jgi:hypothetical protein
MQTKNTSSRASATFEEYSSYRGKGLLNSRGGRSSIELEGTAGAHARRSERIRAGSEEESEDNTGEFHYS